MSFRRIVRVGMGFAVVWFGVVLVLGAEPSVTVYLMDNGVRADHKSFESIRIESVDLVSHDGNLEGRESEPFGDHATFLAGLIVERAPEAQLISVRTLNEQGEGKWSEFIRGVHWIINHHQAGQPAVANLSLGGGVDEPRIQRLITNAIEQLVAKGVVVVVAAGNDGIDDTRRIPSTLDSVISVGAVSMFDRRLDSSNFGSCVDVYVRGDDMEGPGSFSNIYRTRQSGTSVAAAIVTGHIAARLLEEPGSTPRQIRQWVLAESIAGKVKNLPEANAKEALLFRDP